MRPLRIARSSDTATLTDVAYLEAPQRRRGRAEELMCGAKDTGLANLPSADFAINAARMPTALMAHDLLAPESGENATPLPHRPHQPGRLLRPGLTPGRHHRLHKAVGYGEARDVGSTGDAAFHVDPFDVGRRCLGRDAKDIADLLRGSAGGDQHEDLDLTRREA